MFVSGARLVVRGSEPLWAVPVAVPLWVALPWRVLAGMPLCFPYGCDGIALVPPLGPPGLLSIIITKPIARSNTTNPTLDSIPIVIVIVTFIIIYCYCYCWVLASLVALRLAA